MVNGKDRRITELNLEAITKLAINVLDTLTDENDSILKTPKSFIEMNDRNMVIRNLIYTKMKNVLVDGELNGITLNNSKQKVKKPFFNVDGPSRIEGSVTSDEIETIVDIVSDSNKIIRISRNGILASLDLLDASSANNFSGVNELIKNILGKEVTFIKNIVVPTIREYIAKVESKFNGTKNRSPLEDIKMVYDVIPDIIKELINRESVNVHSQTVDLNVDGGTVMLFDLETPVISNIFYDQPQGELKRLVEDIKPSVKDEDLRRIWDKYLAVINEKSDVYNDLTYTVHHNLYSYDLYILKVLVNTMLNKETIGEHTLNGKQRRALMSLNNFLDMRIVLKQRKLNGQNVSGVISQKIVKNDNGSYGLYIAKEVYDKYISDGGEPEIIFGAAISGVSFISVATINGKEEEYMKIWERFVKNSNTVYQLNGLSNVRASYAIAMSDLINDYIDDNTKRSISDDFIKDYNNILVNYLNNESQVDLLNIKDMGTSIMTDLVFKTTNAKRFLKHMVTYSKINKDLTANEAATYAVSDMLMEFLMTQVDIIELV